MGRARKGTPTATIDWCRVPAADDLVSKLVPAYHAHLEGARIICVGKPKADIRRGRVHLAKAVKVGEFANTLRDLTEAPYDYAVQIGMDRWNAMPERDREILIDHELCHFAGQDPKGRWTLTGHDVEEFGVIIRRWGLWTGALQAFAKEIRQQELPLEGAKP